MCVAFALATRIPFWYLACLLGGWLAVVKEQGWQLQKSEETTERPFALLSQAGPALVAATGATATATTTAARQLLRG
jgi:hypothetical protein